MTRRPRAARGAFLFELMVALAVFLATGLAILGAVRQSQRGLISAVERSRAADLALSAAASIEAGIDTPDNLDGPVEIEPQGVALTDAPPEPSGWELEIETDRAGSFGLTVLTVTAFNTDNPAWRYTARRLIVLESDAADDAFEDSELQRLLDEAIDREERLR